MGRFVWFWPVLCLLSVAEIDALFSLPISLCSGKKSILAGCFAVPGLPSFSPGSPEASTPFPDGPSCFPLLARPLFRFSRRCLYHPRNEQTYVLWLPVPYPSHPG